jgi:ParB family chromosome partitioning protein
MISRLRRHCPKWGEDEIDEKVGEKYNLSKNTVARYLRLNELIPELLARVDTEEIAFIPA